MTHAIVNKQETRRLKEIVEIINVNPDGVAITNTPFVWNAADDHFYFKKTSKIFEKIMKRYGMRLDDLELEFKKRVRLIYNLYKKQIFDYNDIQKVIVEYYKKPDEVLRKYGVL